MTRCIVNSNSSANNIDRLFNNFFNHAQFPNFEFTQSQDFNPKVNIIDSADSVNLIFELPGMERGDIKILVKDQILTISGYRKIETEVKDDKYVRSEILSGSFSRSFNLPDTVDSEKVSADYKNGLLHVILTKREEKKPKEIEVQIS